MQLFSLLSAISLTSAFITPQPGVYKTKNSFIKRNPEQTFFHQKHNNKFDSRLIFNQPFRPDVGLNSFSSFEGEYWFKRYDSVFASPYSEYSHIIHIIEGVLQKRSLNTDETAYLVKLFSDVGLPKEFEEYLTSQNNEDSEAHETKEYTNPVFPKDGTPSMTTRYPDIPSQRYRDDIPREYRLLKDPRSILNRRSVEDFIENSRFSLQDIKYLGKMVREDYEFRSKVKKYLSTPIHQKLISDEFLPYFIDIMKSIYSHSTDHEFYGKIHHLQIKTENEEVVSFYDYFASSKSKLVDLKSQLEDPNLTNLNKIHHILGILELNYKNGSPISPADLCSVLLETRKNYPIVLMHPDMITEFTQVVSDLKHPLEIIIIASLVGVPQDYQATMLEKFDLEQSEKEIYQWLGHQIANLDSDNLVWVLDEFLTHHVISEQSIAFKLDLLSSSRHSEAIDKHWQKFENNQDFEWFVKILVDYSGLLNKQKQEKFTAEILAYIGKTKPIDDKRDLVLKGLRAMKLGGSSNVIEGMIKQIKDACNQASPDKDQIMVMVNQLMLEMHHWETKELLDYIVNEHGDSRARKHQQNLSKWLDKKTHANSIDIQGIALQVNDDPVYPQMVPEKASAALVMTKTAKRVLKNLAGQWRTGSVTLLEGPTSAGKTSYVKYMSYLSNSPYMRINLSANTDVRDLIGRWVGGEERFQPDELKGFSDRQLNTIAKNMGIFGAKVNRNKIIEQILLTQKEAHWEDGPVVQAMRQGMVLLLDELNLAKPQVIEALNSLFDSGRLTIDDHGGEVVQLHPKTHIFATMNPSTYVGRNSMSEAFLSRCNKLWVEAPDTEDVVQIVETLYPGVIPQLELAKLVSTHEALTNLADQGHIGKTLGGIAYTLRNLFRVVERYKYFHGNTNLSAEQLLLREFREVYLSTITDEDELKIINDILLLNMPVDESDFYTDLNFTINADGFTIGDVRVKGLNLRQSDLTPDLRDSEVVMTDRTKKIFYKMVKALELGEHVALVGERASGKTILAEYYAALRGQPFYRQVFSAKSDNMELIGMYTPNGWQNGLLVRAGLSEEQGKGDSPGVFLADEFNQANDAVQERLNSLLDKDRTLFLSEKGGGEKVTFADDFRFIAAFNPPSYAGRKRLSKAMQSRLSVQFVPNLENKEEYQIIFSIIAKKKGVSQGIVRRLVDLHFWVKEQIEARELGDQLIKNKYIFSIRQLRNAVKSLRVLTGEQGDVVDGFKLAAELVYESVFESEEDKEKVRTKVKELCR
ncbi:MAG: AAA family ATPase [Oligoflexales bacterium]